MDGKTIKTIVITAAIACLLTNTVRDYIYVSNNGEVISKLSEVTEKIVDYSIYQPDSAKMADLGATALALAVNDKYTRYIEKADYKEYLDSTMSSYFGVGITLSSDFVASKVVITDVAEGGPSERAGVLAGDVLLKSDGKDCTPTNISEIVSAIKGKTEGQNVTLTLERNGEKLDVVVPIEKVESKFVSGQMLADGIGYIKISKFEGNTHTDSRTAYDDFVDLVSELRDEGMTRMIIDLRDNLGGQFGVVASIADEIISDGIIVSTEDKNGKRNTLHAQKGGLDYPIAVVTNSKSASASEVLTAALKDNGRAIVVGEKTFGKGVVQTYFSLSDGSGLAVTSARYFTPDGICIDGVGIEPDIAVSLPDGKTPKDFTPETDPQVLRAVGELNK